MVPSPQSTALHTATSDNAPVQWRYTLAALVYFLYGLFYFFGAEYFVNMQPTERTMSNSHWFFVLGGLFVVLLPWLIYQRFMFALSWCARRHTERKSLFIDFTLLLGCLVSVRVMALLVSRTYLKTPWHTAALLVACINAVCLLWAGARRPGWIQREPLVPPSS